MIFFENRLFTARLKGFLGDDAYREFQNVLLANPRKGAVLAGCGGLRKVRVEDEHRGKGKRGGARVVYLHLPEIARLYFLAIYSKDEQDDLSFEERRVLAMMARQAKAEAAQILKKGGLSK